MYCLDTSIVIDILQGDKDLAGRIDSLLSDGEEVGLTPISLCELFQGAFLHFKSDEKVKEIESFISLFSVLDFSINSCKWFGEEYSRLKKYGKIPSEADLMIASIAKANNLILITRDKDFKNINVEAEFW